MKTYEDMKHNIPEGATHYSDECDNHNFTWFKYNNGTPMLFHPKMGVWLSSMFKRKIKPIPTEPKYRYEKVTESIFDLKGEFERGELYFAWLGNPEPGSNSVGYDKITDEKMLLCRYEEKRLLRRIEVTERDEFIEQARNALGCDLNNDGLGVLCKLYDAGCRFLNGKE